MLPSLAARPPEQVPMEQLLRSDPRASDPFRHSRAAECAASLEADKELLHLLMLSGYSGREWERFRAVLAEYGMSVMNAWIRTGQIFAQCETRRLGVGRIVARSPDDVRDMATDAVALAIVAFRDKVLIPRVWDPGKGASLLTFFVGQCVFQFSNVYRKWRAEKRRHLSVAPEVIAQELAYVRRATASVETLTELARQLQRLAPDSAGAIDATLEMGYSVAEVADSLGMKRRTVEAKVYRHRRRLL